MRREAVSGNKYNKGGLHAAHGNKYNQGGLYTAIYMQHTQPRKWEQEERVKGS